MINKCLFCFLFFVQIPHVCVSQGGHSVSENNFHTRSVFRTIKDLGLKGKVQSINQCVYGVVYKFGVVEKGDKISDLNYSDFTRIHFNEKGDLIEKDDWNSSSEYNSNGDLVKTVEWFKYWLINTLTINFKYRDNMLFEKEIIRGDILFKKHVYKYFEGNEVEEDIYNSEGQLDCKISNIYDQKNLNIGREVSSYRDGSLTKKELCKYNEYGLIQYSTVYYFKNIEVPSQIKEFSTYDTSGNVIEQITYNEALNDTLNKYVYTYKNNTLVEEIKYAKTKYQGTLIHKIEIGAHSDNEIEPFTKTRYLQVVQKCSFSEQGDMLSLMYYDENDKLIENTYKYQYDQYGNWINMVVCVNKSNKLPEYISITERQINYF